MRALTAKETRLLIGLVGALFVLLSGLIIAAFGDVRVDTVGGPRTADIGLALFRDWVLPFEVLSMLLLAALVGAIVLSRREDGESGEVQYVTRILLADDPDLYCVDDADASADGAAGEVRA